jgi:sugar/nucleoside kinase (ribokinase family)
MRNINSKIVEDILNSVSILSGNELEYEVLMKQFGVTSEQNLLNIFPNIQMLWVKKGSKGAMVIEKQKLNGSEKYYTYDSTIEKIVTANNTTGCGDVFNAVVIAGLYNGWLTETILSKAIEESSKIAERGLPWVQKF